MNNEALKTKIKQQVRLELVAQSSINESFVGKLTGIAGGIAAAIAQIIGGSLVLVGGISTGSAMGIVGGGIIMASSIWTGLLVGAAVTKSAELKALRKLDQELAKNVTTRDNLLTTYTNSLSSGLVDEQKYSSMVSKLTKEQKNIGNKIMKHMRGSKSFYDSMFNQTDLKKLSDVVSAAMQGQITSVANFAQNRLVL